MALTEEQPCYSCGDKTVGTVWDNSILKAKYVCGFCYQHILQMRPLGQRVTKDEAKTEISKLNELQNTDRVSRAIARYTEILYDQRI